MNENTEHAVDRQPHAIRPEIGAARLPESESTRDGRMAEACNQVFKVRVAAITSFPLRRVDPVVAERIELLRDGTQAYPVQLTIEPDGEFALWFNDEDYRAARELGLEEIDAQLLPDDEITAELKDIYLRVLEGGLGPGERGELTARFKELYEARYPETQHGGKPKRHGVLPWADALAGGNKSKRRSNQRYAQVHESLKAAHDTRQIDRATFNRIRRAPISKQQKMLKAAIAKANAVPVEVFLPDPAATNYWQGVESAIQNILRSALKAKCDIRSSGFRPELEEILVQGIEGTVGALLEAVEADAHEAANGPTHDGSTCGDEGVAQ